MPADQALHADILPAALELQLQLHQLRALKAVPCCVQARVHRNSEQHLFRELLLGGGPPS